jgi:sigma-E processing peptidase SpoIIGA
MQVYIELAIAENFCMDFTLLYSAKLICKNRCGAWRVALCALLGAGFAVVYPLFGLNGVWAVIVKLVSGCLLVMFAGRFESFKGYIKMLVAFFILCFVVGGALIGACFLTGADYLQGEGYLISSLPLGIPLFAALILFLLVKKLAKKVATKLQKNCVSCHIYVGELCAEAQGFYDSGNSVYYHGQPVCIVPGFVAKKLIDVGGIKSFTEVHTVAGREKLPVFTADRIEIEKDDGIKVFYKVKIGVSAHPIYKAVLHPDLSEVN